MEGPHREPWLHVLDAGTCWATARLSQVPSVTEVVALDMSERFLTDVGTRVIGHFGGIAEKIKFAVGSFNDIPFPHASFDCAFLVASIHHSLSPVKTLIDRQASAGRPPRLARAGSRKLFQAADLSDHREERLPA